jgi:hypothetical protein
MRPPMDSRKTARPRRRVLLVGQSPGDLARELRRCRSSGESRAALVGGCRAARATQRGSGRNTNEPPKPFGRTRPRGSASRSIEAIFRHYGGVPESSMVAISRRRSPRPPGAFARKRAANAFSRGWARPARPRVSNARRSSPNGGARWAALASSLDERMSVDWSRSRPYHRTSIAPAARCPAACLPHCYSRAVRSRGWAWILVLAGCVTAPEQASPAVTRLAPPMFAERSIEAPSVAAPAGARGDSPPRRRDIHDICAQSAEVGIAWCEAMASGDPKDCVEMCVAEFRASHPPEHRVSARPIGAPPPAAPALPPDPYFFALADCIHRTREGEAPSACRFATPLDQMDFGQRHCDARCAELAGADPAAIPIP